MRGVAVTIGLVASVLGGAGATAARAADVAPAGPSLSSSPSRETMRTVADLRGLVRRETKVAHSFRLRVDTAVGTVPGADGRDRIHQRVARSMVDLYPVRDEGFRLSAGSRFVQRRAPGDLRGLAFTSRAGSNGVLRPGLRGFNPALTVGYQGEVAPKFSLGVEVGALKGRAWQRIRGGDTARDNGRDPVGSIVNVDAALKF